MTHTDAPTLDPSVYRRNLAALTEADPALTGCLTRLPDSNATTVVTRDGQLSFRLPQPDGSVAWFGRTSIPSVRAAALLDKFDAGQANVLLPALGEGSEARLLLQTLGPHRAVFVWQEDLGAIRLALQLHDLAAAIKAGRLVFLCCPPDRLAETLAACLDAHPGHLCPDRLMMWPWQTPADIAPSRSAVETVYQQIEQRRQQALAQILARSTSQPQSPRSASPTVALIALRADDETWTVTDALSAAATKAGYQPVPVDVRTPGDMHPLARASKLADTFPQQAILVDVVRDQVRDILPATIPAIVWIGPQAGLARQIIAQIGDDRLVVTHAALGKVVGKTISPTPAVCPPPCLAPLDDKPTETDRPIDVIIFPNVAPVDADAIKPGLPTYATVWKTAVDLLTASIETFTDDQANALLTRAEAKSKSTIDDANTRRELLDVLSHHVAPTLLIRFLAQTLENNNLSFQIRGPGWPDLFPRRAGPAGSVRNRFELMRQARFVLHADVTGLSVINPLLAAASGALLLTRNHSAHRQRGGLLTLLEPDQETLTFTRARDLIDHIRHLTADESARRAITAKACQRCRSQHTPEARFQTLQTIASSVPGQRPALA